MANLILKQTMGPGERAALMQQDALFDIASSDEPVPDFTAIKQRMLAGPALGSVPKVFLSNDCIFNCAYCGCRSSRDGKRPYQCTPRELAELSVELSARGKKGVFLSSAIYRTPDYTQELIVETLRILRRDLGYQGYVHAKVMPGADPELIRLSGEYANRLSVNIEVANSEGYEQIARNKNKSNILTPMGHISRQIRAAKTEQGRFSPAFATSQTTQLMAGSTGEDDHTILRLSSALYRKYALSRVYYTAFQYQDPAVGYDLLAPASTPVWRVRRLYQADRLMQLYGFSPEDITPETSPLLSQELDPKIAWALRNLHLFPIEVNKADYHMLIRIPGIGVTYAKRIIKARKYCTITHDVLRSLGVATKRSRHFMTCNGKYTGDTCDNPDTLYRLLAEPAGGLAGQLSL